MATGFELPTATPPEDPTQLRVWLYRVWLTLQQLMAGKTNNTGQFTLAANVATTTVNDDRVGGASKITWAATTANAATATGNLYISSKGKKTFTLTHANNAQTDRTFDYIVTG